MVQSDSLQKSSWVGVLRPLNTKDLPNDRPCIRLLKVESGKDSNIIRCALQTVNLDEKPQYLALSYSWSITDPKKPKSGERGQYVVQNLRDRVIICNNQLLRIQRNLYNFLLRFRQETGACDQYIWIDAICINQDPNKENKENQEKRFQLGLMGRIYSSASTVLVWLGEITWTAKQGLRFIGNLPPASEGTKSLEYYRDVINNPAFETPDELLDRGRIWDYIKYIRGMVGLFEILSREYFERCWVVQELVLAPQLRFILGSADITADQLLRAIWFYSELEQDQSISLIDPSFFCQERIGFKAIPALFKARMDHREGNPWPIERYITLCRDRVASDPKDKVLALLGLLDHPMQLEFNDPERRSKSLQELYVDCTKVIANAWDWDRTLCLVEKIQPGREDLPSWVPDYRVSCRPKPFSDCGCPGFSATISAAPHFEVCEIVHGDNGETKRWALDLSAAYFNTIIQVGESLEAITHLRLIHGHMLDLITKLGTHYIPTGELTMDAFQRTLVANFFSNSNIDGQVLADWFRGWLVSIFCEGVSLTLSKTVRYLTETQVRKYRDRTFDKSSLSLTSAIAEFVKVHDSELYPISHDFYIVQEPRPVREYVDQDFEPTYTKAVTSVYEDRRLFRTERGYLGIGPISLVDGDKVMLVAGARQPFIFRTTADGEANLNLIGSAYVHGIMHGEALGLASTSFKTFSVI